MTSFKSSIAVLAAVSVVSLSAQALEKEMDLSMDTADISSVDSALDNMDAIDESIDMDSVTADSVENHGNHPGHHNNSGGNHPGNHGNAACKKLKLTDAQKADLKTTFTEAKKSGAEIRKELQAARKEYVKLVLTPSSDFVAADAATLKIQAAATKAIELRTNTMNKVLFKIMTADQRKSALACFSKKNHKPQGGHGHGHAHGHGHGHGHGHAHP